MDFAPVRDAVEGIPHMRPSAGRKVYDHVIRHGLTEVLELGAYHGVSTCYLAAAVDELGGGRVVTIDRNVSRRLDPNIHDLAERTGLADIIEPIFAERSFTWELKRILDQPELPQFDFVFLDAGHMWDTTGFAFFLVDRLLRPGGWMLFDDLDWSIAASRSVTDAAWAREYSAEERSAHQVRAVFELLVETDPRYETRTEGNWGWAKKVGTEEQTTIGPRGNLRVRPRRGISDIFDSVRGKVRSVAAGTRRRYTSR